MASTSRRPPVDPPCPVAERALGYPYPRPASSFVWHAGAVHTIPDAAWRGVSAAGDLPVACDRAKAALRRVAEAGAAPVLAIGSNAGPAQITRKYDKEINPAFADAAIPVIRAMLLDHDVTYAALISSYGSATATLTHTPGTAVEIYITYLTADLLERMHETEAAYDLVTLPPSSVVVGASADAPAPHPSVPQLGAAAADAPLAYVHQKGAVLLPCPRRGPAVDTPIALAEIRAINRSLPALTQHDAQALIAALLDGAPPDDVAAWARANVADDDARRARVAALGARAQPLRTPGAEHVARLGCVFGRSVD